MEVVKYYDCKIIEGHRTTERQQELYAQGRTTPGNIVTHKDGILRLSKHQQNPSPAIDVVPYPVDWNATHRFYEMSGWVKCIAMGMNIPIQWGGDWPRFRDLPHWELRP